MKIKYLPLALCTLGLVALGTGCQSATTGQGVIGADLTGVFGALSKDQASQTLDVTSPMFGTLHWARNGGATNSANYQPAPAPVAPVANGVNATAAK